MTTPTRCRTPTQHGPGDFCADCAERALELAKANRYAEAMTRRDLEQRHTGTQAHDIDTTGRPLRRGT